MYIFIGSVKRIPMKWFTICLIYNTSISEISVYINNKEALKQLDEKYRLVKG